MAAERGGRSRPAEGSGGNACASRLRWTVWTALGKEPVHRKCV